MPKWLLKSLEVKAQLNTAVQNKYETAFHLAGCINSPLWIVCSVYVQDPKLPGEGDDADGGENGDGGKNGNDGDDGDDDDDIYIMMQCLCVCVSRKIITSSWEFPVTT